MSGPLANLAVLSDTTSRRASSWDRTGGNDDRLSLAPGDRAVLAHSASRASSATYG
jgi:hypothetical protein